MKHLLFVALLLFVFGAPTLATDSKEDRVVTKVRLYKDGRVTLDESPVTHRQLRKALATFKKEGGDAVYYFIEGSRTNEEHSSQIKVLRIIMSTRLSIRLSADEDFSTALMPDGTSVPVVD